MARKSQRLSAASQGPPAHKRAASGSAVPDVTAKRPRQGNGKATPTKSQYFQHASDDESVDEPSSGGEEGSDFEDEANDSLPSDPDEDEGGEDEEYESADDKPKRSNKATPRKGATTSTAIRAKGQELWRPGVKTGLGPGTQVVIKKPKARPAGKTAYEDETIHPNTLLFLADLKANNDRQWLKSKSQGSEASLFLADLLEAITILTTA